MNAYRCKVCGTIYKRWNEKKVRKIDKCKKCGKVVALQLVETDNPDTGGNGTWEIN